MAHPPQSALELSERLRNIADHLDFMGVSITAEACTGPLRDVLTQCLNDLSAHAAAGTVMPARGRCVLLERLRIDATTQIMLFLDIPSLLRFAASCWALQRAVRKVDYIWRSLAESFYPLWYMTARLAIKPSVSDGTSVWRQMFIERTQTDALWRRPIPNATLVKRFLRGIHSLHFDRDALLLGSGQYNEVLSFDLKAGRLHSGANGSGMFGHSQAVTGLKPLPNNMLLTSSLDTTLRLFDRSTLQNTKVFTGHTDKVWCLDVHENRVFSGSSDKTVRIWDLESTEAVAEPLRSHRTSISAIKVVTTGPVPLLFMGSAGNTVRVWDIAESTPRCIEKLRGHTKGVFCLQSTPSVLMSGSLDNIVKVWDPRQGFRLIYELRQKDAAGRDLVANTDDNETNIGVIAFQCDDTKVVTGGPDKVVRIWDLRTRQIVNELDGHAHWITTLQFDGNKIVTGSRDKTVRFWDVTGKLLEEVSPELNDHEDGVHLPPANLNPGPLLPAPATQPNA
jgi:WD40 repeat protein